MLLLFSAIPYRADPAIDAGQVLWTVVVTVGLLALAFVVLLQVRKKGWLDAWNARAGGTGRSPVQTRWQVSSQRISRRTIVHTMTRDGQAVLVVESPAGISVTRLDAVDASASVITGDAEP